MTGSASSRAALPVSAVRADPNAVGELDSSRWPASLPIVAATPEARIVEVGESGLDERRWEGLELGQNWSDFQTDPQVFLRHVLDERWEISRTTG